MFKKIAFFNLFFLILTLNCFSGEADDPLSVYLTWTMSPETTMSIQWISKNSEIDNSVYYKPFNICDEKEQTPFFHKLATYEKMPDGHPFLIHQVELTDLLPGVIYVFKISENGQLYKFKTIPKELTELKFVEGGDIYRNGIDIVEETNRQAAAQNPMFAVIGGDIAYSADPSNAFFPEDAYRWLRFFKAWTNTMVTKEGFLIPIIPVIGNHETRGGYGQTPAEAAFFYAFFPMPGKKGYNVLDFGNYMSLILLDSGHTHPISGQQTEWLEKTLKARSAVPYKFAVYHVPAYPSIRNFSNAVSLALRKNWVPHFDTYSLKVAFEHHDHTYKRTYPLKNGRKHEKGVIYIGDGAWGIAKPRPPARLIPYVEKSAQSRNFILVTLNELCVTYEAINPNGEIIDRVIQKK